MELLAPAQLGWLGLLAPLIGLYILKRRRERRMVGSTLLWEHALRDMRAERPFRRLIPYVSLILQMLIIIAGSIALSRPTAARSTLMAGQVAVVIDTSVSMGAMERGESRLDRARQIAKGIARTLPSGGRMMVVQAGEAPVIAAPWTQDAFALSRAIDSLGLTGGRADLEAAVSLAAERVKAADGSRRIVVLTDAAMDAELALDDRTAEVEVQTVDTLLGNTAIVAADVRPRSSVDAPDRVEIFVRVARHGAGVGEAFVTATVGGGVVASRRLEVREEETEAVVMTADLPPDADGRAPFVHIDLSHGGDDALAYDDHVVLPSPSSRKLPVFLVGAAPEAVRRVLLTDGTVELFATSLSLLAGRDEDAPPLEGLFVYAGAVPTAPPPGDSVVVAPMGPVVFEVQVGEEVAWPRIVSWDEADASLRFVSLADVHLGAIRPIRGAASRPLVQTDRGVAVASISRADGETTVLSFDPVEGDFARHASFVVLFRNLLERARRRHAAGGIPAGRLGEPLRVTAPAGDQVVVTAPSGATFRAVSRGGVAVLPIGAEPGAYGVEIGRRRLVALRNLLDEEESDLTARARFTRGGRHAAANFATAHEPTEAWPYFALMLLALLAIDAIWETRGRMAEHWGRFWSRRRRATASVAAIPVPAGQSERNEHGRVAARRGERS